MEAIGADDRAVARFLGQEPSVDQGAQQTREASSIEPLIR
jgi:hypothetical protein